MAFGLADPEVSSRQSCGIFANASDSVQRISNACCSIVHRAHRNGGVERPKTGAIWLNSGESLRQKRRRGPACLHTKGIGVFGPGQSVGEFVEGLETIRRIFRERPTKRSLDIRPRQYAVPDERHGEIVDYLLQNPLRLQREIE